MESQPPLPIRGLHNFIYCPRLFYYQWVENIFQENADTVEGSHVHRNTDQPSRLDDAQELKELELPEGAAIRSLRLESEKFGLVGVVDIVEGGPDGEVLIDYKKGSARRNEKDERVPKDPDAMQVVAQAILLEEHGMAVKEAFVYYAEDKRRVPVDIAQERRQECLAKIVEAKALAARGQCPPPLKDDPRCLYCSAYPICLPNESEYWRHPDAQPLAVKRAPRPENDEGEILVVQTPGAQVGLKGGQIVVTVKGEAVRKIPSRQLRAVYLYGAVQVTAQAAQDFLEREVDVSFFAPSGRFLGLLRGLPASSVDARRGQYRLFEETGICHAVGLDPFLGVMHQPRYGRPALALDIMEEFRPLIVDSVAVSLVNRGEVNKGDFLVSAAGVFLNEQGRRVFWEVYSRRIDTEVSHPQFEYKMSYRRMLDVQARQMWRFVRGEAPGYTGFTTR